jgi:GT2 family glycosyltransferase
MTPRRLHGPLVSESIQRDAHSVLYRLRVPQVDVVIVTYNSEEYIRSCVLPLCGDADINVIVIDSDSQDRTLELLEDLPVTRIPLHRNRGFAHACNVGWRQGRAPYILFLNPDATIEPTALHVLVDSASESPRVGAVAPKIVDRRGALDYSQRRFPRVRSTFSQALFLHRLFPTADWADELVRDARAYEHRQSPEWASGACLLVRRDALDKLGGFDEAFFLYCDDMDLCRRLRDVGLEILFVPEAVALHEGGASMPRGSLLPMLAESRIRFAHKHGDFLTTALERSGVVLGSLTHALVGRSTTRRGHLAAIPIALGLRRARRP